MCDILSLCCLCVFLGYSQSACQISVIYSLKVCSPFIIPSVFFHTHSPTFPRPIDSLRNQRPAVSRTVSLSMWSGLGDQHFHNEVSTRMTDEVSPLILSLDSKVQRLGKQGREEIREQRICGSFFQRDCVACFSISPH